LEINKNAGLNTVNLGNLTAFQQVVLLILMIIGNVVFVSTAIVVIRRYWFLRKIKHIVKHIKAGKEIARDVERQESHSSKGKVDGKASSEESSSASEARRREPAGNQKKQPQVSEELEQTRRLRGQAGFGSSPWQSNTFQRAIRLPFRSLHNKDPHDREHPYLSFQPTYDHRGRFQELSEHELAELGGVQFRALDLLLWILPLWCDFFVPYAYRSDVKSIDQTSQSGNLNPGWWAFFVNATSFTNTGLNPLNAKLHSLGRLLLHPDLHRCTHSCR